MIIQVSLLLFIYLFIILTIYLAPSIPEIPEYIPMDIPFKKGRSYEYKLIYILESFTNLFIILLISSSSNHLRFY
jgi:hypothetical protein